MAPFTVDFYDPQVKAKDGENRTLDDILKFTDNELEYHHDFIQILFPLPERSPINPRAPVINKETRDAFVQRQELRQQYFRSLVCIARFYGFDITSETIANDKVAIFMKPDPQRFDRNSKLWRTRFGHNHLRITRIIRSLRVLGMEDLAHGFWQTLVNNDKTNSISERTFMFWERAATRPLRLAPEENDEDARGLAWLREVDDAVELARQGRSDGEQAGGYDAETGRMAVLRKDEVAGLD